MGLARCVLVQRRALVTGALAMACSRRTTPLLRRAGSPDLPEVELATRAAPATPGLTGLDRGLPRVLLGRWPTPVRALPELALEIGVGELWIKDDSASAASYGGSKIRKLEHYLGDALARGAREVITLGALGSHQAVATATQAARLGLACTLLLAPERADAYVNDHLARDRAAGAIIERVASVQLGLARAGSLARGRGAVVIPPGGSSPLGNAGFVRAGLELGEQVRLGLLPAPEHVFLALGTMGSAVGLLLGLAVAGLRPEVVLVRASNPTTSSPAALAALLAATRGTLGALEPALVRARLPPCAIEARELGAGYAARTASSREAVRLAGRHGLHLEPTYTGKALAALARRAREGALGRVLFWNTHAGLPE